MNTAEELDAQSYAMFITMAARRDALISNKTCSRGELCNNLLEYNKCADIVNNTISGALDIITDVFTNMHGQ